jgi:hypothetical protein
MFAWLGELQNRARAEARQHPAGAEEVQRMRDALRQARGALPGGPSTHTVRFDPQTWADVIDEQLPDLNGRDRISRADVVEVAAAVRDSLAEPVALLTASYLWGQGGTGYGRHRHDQILQTPKDRLQVSLTCALERLDRLGPVGAYAWLYGSGEANLPRLPAGDPRTGRLSGWGPAFFTKLLYFASASASASASAESMALILDARLAIAVTDLSGLPYQVSGTGQARAWTPYRYAVYLEWMRNAADALGASPDELEVALFDHLHTRPNAD